jgi:hypothetical protein
MQKHFFWSQWDQPFKHIATILFITLLVLITTSVVLIGMGSEGLLGWHTFSQKVPIDVVSQTVNLGPFSFGISEQLIVIKEFVSGGEMPNSELIKQVSLIITLSLFTFMLALISYFNRWGFVAFSVFAFFFIIFLHPEMLQMVELGDSWLLAGVFALLIGPAYYFQSFKRDASFSTRLIVLIVVMGIFVMLVLVLSKMASPLNALYSYGILAPYLVVLLFILLVGHEIVNGFAVAIAGSKEESDNKRILHFLALTFIYLVNILLSYLQITHVINWNFISVNPIILLAAASIFGLWGISHRFVLYKNVNSEQKIWVLLYLGVAVMAFLTINYLLFSLEDPMLKIISDFIIFTQLALGVSFMIYIVYNFSSVIEKGYSIKEILYKPQNLPHVTYRLVGIVILTALVLMRDIKYPIWYSLGGFYNSVASYFEDQGNDELSIVFYERGADLSKNNHKSNYKLGMIKIDSDRENAIKYFDVATTRLPSPQAFINKANLEEEEGMYFDALFSLQNGVRKIEGTSEIYNNIGLQFSKANMLDSAWHYFSLDKNFNASKNNALAFVLENNFSITETDSVFLFSDLNMVGLVNASALGFKPEKNISLSGDNMITASILNNLLLNQLIPFSASAYESILSIVDSTKNPMFSEELNYAIALYELRNGLVTDALLRLQKLTTHGSDKEATYFETMGLINLRYGSFNEAEKFLLLAAESKKIIGKSYLTQLALAQSEAGYFDDALFTWNKVIEHSIEEDSLKAVVMTQVLKSIMYNNDSIDGDDISFYLKAKYQRLWVDEYSVKATLDRIVDKFIKNQIALELATYYFESGNTSAATLFYNMVNPEPEEALVLRPLLYLNIRMAYAGLAPELNKQLQSYYDAGFEFGEDQRLQKYFFETNRTEITHEFAEKLATENPYFAEGVVWAAQYFEEDADEYRSYNILQEALDKNPDSRIIMEAFMLKAIDIGLEEYATNTLQRYRELFPGDQFRSFEQKLQEKKAKFYEWEDEE